MTRDWPPVLAVLCMLAVLAGGAWVDVFAFAFALAGLCVGLAVGSMLTVWVAYRADADDDDPEDQT